MDAVYGKMLLLLLSELPRYSTQLLTALVASIRPLFTAYGVERHTMDRSPSGLSLQTGSSHQTHAKHIVVWSACPPPGAVIDSAASHVDIVTQILLTYLQHCHSGCALVNLASNVSMWTVCLSCLRLPLCPHVHTVHPLTSASWSVMD